MWQSGQQDRGSKATRISSPSHGDFSSHSTHFAEDREVTSQNPSGTQDALPTTTSLFGISDCFQPSVSSSSREPGLQSVPSPPVVTLVPDEIRSTRAASGAAVAALRATLEVLPTSGKIPPVRPEVLTLRDREEGSSDILPSPLHAPQTDRYASTTPTKLSLHKELSMCQPQAAKELEPPILRSMEFVVPLPLPPSQRDQCNRIFKYYQKSILELFSNHEISKTIKLDIDCLITRLNNVTTHWDLDDATTLTQQEIAPEDSVRWAVDISGKFQFLKHLLEIMRHQDEHIAIVAGGSRLLAIIETFLIGMHMDYGRPHNLSSSQPDQSHGRLQVSLIPSGEEGASALPKFASLVIAFDDSFDPEENQIRALRNHLLNSGQLSPVVHLLVYCSAAHILQCIPVAVTGPDRLRVLVDCIDQNRHMVGELQPTEAGPVAAAEEVAAFIEAGGRGGQWTLPYIRRIPFDGIEDVDAAPEVESHMSQIQSCKEYASVSITRKRALVGDCPSAEIPISNQHVTNRRKNQ